MPRESRRRARASRRRARPSSTERSAPAAPGEERAVARGVWSGSLSFGLVTIPVELFSATRPRRATLRRLAPDGTPLVRRFFCSADGRRLEDDEIVRGFEVEEGRFVVVDDDELERLAPRRSRDIELLRFVPRDAIDPAYFQRAYFVMPGAEQSKAYRLLARAMEKSERAAIASFVMRGKAYALAIFAERGLLEAVTLRFHDELRAPDAIPVPAKAKPAQVSALRREIASLERPALDERELDDGVDLLALAREKLARGEDVIRAPEPAGPEEGGREPEADEERGGEVIDLFELIQKRLREPRAKPAAKRAVSRRPRQRARRR